jgi:hypothetical protein
LENSKQKQSTRLRICKKGRRKRLLTELSAKKNVNPKDPPGKVPEPWCDGSSQVSEVGSDVIEAQVDYEAVLKERVNYCGSLAGRSVIPGRTNVGESEKHFEVIGFIEVKSCAIWYVKISVRVLIL